MVSVVTVDDQEGFRLAARQVIEATPGFRAAGEAASGEEALALVDEIQPQLVLLDVRMPGMGGIEAARQIHARQPSAVVVLISLEDRDDVAHRLADTGAAEFVRKQEFGPALLRALWERHGPGLT